MDPLPTYLRKFNTEVLIMSSSTSDLRYWSILKPLLSSQFILELEKKFGYNPALIKALACPEYLLSISIWGILSVLEVSFTSRLNIPLGIALKGAFVCVITIFGYFSFWFPKQYRTIGRVRFYNWTSHEHKHYTLWSQSYAVLAFT